MSAAPQAMMLPDGRRLHLHHGPIDLIIEVWGLDREACYAAAIDRFQTILAGLVDDLKTLRGEITKNTVLKNPTSHRMQRAVSPFSDVFVTPMAAVAGAVADEVLYHMIQGHDVTKAYVNNGGDIAFHLTPGQSFTSLSASGTMVIPFADPARGLASSGWRGRSQSLGIADTVSVKAKTAAQADVAATLIANAVDLPGHPAIQRQPANEISPDSDLGDRLVTTEVGLLSVNDIAAALDAGVTRAADFCARDVILDATLLLQGHSRAIGDTTRTNIIKDPAYA